jgi:hypothetical protein
MPTIGWILERDLDAFYEATDHTSHPTPAAPTFACPFCSSCFSRQSEIHTHVYEAHRVQRPLLLIKGVEPPATTILRASLEPTDILLTNTSLARVYINGSRSRYVSPSELPRTLAAIKQAEIKLDLINDTQKNATPVSSHYTISFRVADQGELKSVEKAFTDSLVATPISRDSIGKFVSHEGTQGAGKEYASGLAEYCLGILIKERPEEERLTTPLFRYRELYGGALEILKDFQRPLAHLITSIIRFSLNDVTTVRRKTGYWELDVATEFLSDPSSDLVWPKTTDAIRRPVCPVDHGTGRILELASRLLAQQRWSPILDDECRALTRSGVLDAGDHQKAFAIWAASAWRLGARQSAIEPLTQIAEIYPFSRWASKYLEKAQT